MAKTKKKVYSGGRCESTQKKKYPFFLMNNEKQIINLFNYVFIHGHIRWAGGRA